MSDAFAFDYVSCKRPSSTEPTLEPWKKRGDLENIVLHARSSLVIFTLSCDFVTLTWHLWLWRAEFFALKETADFDRLLKILARRSYPKWYKIPDAKCWGVWDSEGATFAYPLLDPRGT